MINRISNVSQFPLPQIYPNALEATAPACAAPAATVAPYPPIAALCIVAYNPPGATLPSQAITLLAAVPDELILLAVNGEVRCDIGVL